MARPRVAFVGPLERVLSLRALPMLERLTADELTAIAQHARERSFPKGGRLTDPAKPTTAAYVVLDGRVIVRRENGSEVVGPNESVGFVDLLARSVTGLDATADVDTQALELDWDAQLDVCEQHFTIFLQYIRYLCERCTNQLSLKWPTNQVASADGFTRRDGLLNVVERALVFRQSPVFASCSADAVWELVKHVTEVTFAPRETIWDIGDTAHFFLLIVSGDVQCESTSGGASTATRGTTVGMFEAMSTQARWYKATSATQVTALLVDDNSFLDILEDHFDMAIEYTAAIARELLTRRP